MPNVLVNSQDLARALAGEMSAQMNHSGAQTDDQLIELFISTRGSENTRTAYRRAISSFVDFCSKPLSGVSVMDFERYKSALEEKYESEATRRSKLMPIKSLFTYANKIGYLRFNVPAAVDVKSVKSALHRKVLSEADIKSALDSVTNEKHKTMLYLLYASGARVGEFVALKWSDVLFDEKLVIFTETKNGDPRKVPIKPKVISMLKFYRDRYDGPKGRTDFVFGTKYRGAYKGYTRSAMNKMLNRVRKNTGVDITPHKFRHSIITHSLNNGVPIQVVRDRAGHGSLAMTSLYAHDTDGAPLVSSVLD